jgi:hypothetical protein
MDDWEDIGKREGKGITFPHIIILHNKDIPFPSSHMDDPNRRKFHVPHDRIKGIRKRRSI